MNEFFLKVTFCFLSDVCQTTIDFALKVCLSFPNTSTHGHFSIILPYGVDSKKSLCCKKNAKLI